MDAYLIPIETAIIIFPFLALLITLPFVIKQYRTYGSVLILRAFIIYSFIFYLLCAYFLTILPLPAIEDVAALTTPYVSLIPFDSIRNLLENTSLVWNDTSTYLNALSEPHFFEIAFNILMIVPLGIYLRYYYQFSFKKTIFISFLVSLSFELIQLSALFGIYPRPYRLFEIDDLMKNTLGGILGFAITPLFSSFLPSRTELDTIAFKKGEHVSDTRRCLAFLCDITIVISFLTCMFVVGNGFYHHYGMQYIEISYILIIFIYFIMIPILTHGRTIGKRIVKIRLVQKDDQEAKWY